LVWAGQRGAATATDHTDHQRHSHDKPNRQWGATTYQQIQLGPAIEVLSPQAEQQQQ
jgi:hypothetical protein